MNTNDIKIIKLGEFGNSPGTRKLGNEIRNKVLVFLSDGNNIMFDFFERGGYLQRICR